MSSLTGAYTQRRQHRQRRQRRQRRMIRWLPLAVASVAVGACEGAGAGGGPGGSMGRGGAIGAGGTGGQGGDRCTWSDTYTVVDSPGFVARVDTVTFAPPNMFRYERRSSVPEIGQASCSPALPACGDPAGIDVADIERDIMNADVQTAFTSATPPVYGVPVSLNGASFSFLRSDQRGFYSLYPCDASVLTCMSIPPGAAALVADLRALIMRQLADPSCAAFR